MTTDPDLNSALEAAMAEAARRLLDEQGAVSADDVMQRVKRDHPALVDRLGRQLVDDELDEAIGVWTDGHGCAPTPDELAGVVRALNDSIGVEIPDQPAS